MNKKITKAYSHKDWKEEQMKDPEFVKALNEPDEDPYIQMAYQILQLRKKYHLTQDQLAKKLKTSQQDVARLESPDYKGYTFKTAERVTEAFNKKFVPLFV